MFLTAQAAATKATASGDAARLGMLQQLEKVFGTGAGAWGMRDAAVQFVLRTGAAPRHVGPPAVIARAEDFGLAGPLEQRPDRDAAAERLQRHQELGQRGQRDGPRRGRPERKIASALATGHTPNDLMDSRDQLINKISEKIEVQTIQANDGSLSVFIGGGQSLVLGGLSNKLVARQDDFDPARASVGISVAGNITPLATSSLGAGSIAGLMQFRTAT